MDLFLKFRKDYFNYLLSIILPALITGISIPVFKHLLGAKGYGNFSIWFNAVLIITGILSGWITQSIIRFYPASANKHIFSKKSIILSLKTQLIFFLPVLIGIWYISNDFFLSVLCSVALVVTCLQFSVLPIIQSSFLSKKIIFSEIIRVITYVGCAIFFLEFSGVSYLYALFIAIIISYTFSLFYLLKQAIFFFNNEKYSANDNSDKRDLFQKFFNYGAPLSFWFVFTYLLSYIDKLFMFKNLGSEIQGNYQAIFDLLSKSIVLIISPIITSLFPILTSAYIKGDNSEIRRLLKKIIFYEVGGFMIISIFYWWFGANLLFAILKIPNTFTFRIMGFIIICGTFIWQISILVQKRFELKLKSLYLLGMVAIAFVLQVGLYFIFQSYNNQLLYPLGFLFSSIVYLFLISISEVIAISKFVYRRKIIKN